MIQSEVKPSVIRTAYAIVFYICAWYTLSLITLWTNRYIVAELKVDSNLLSFAQLGMSVICGLLSEVYYEGYLGCIKGLKKSFQYGLKDMIALGGVRILTILLGLTALKYIAVSFTQTIKSAAPFFTVILTYLLLGQRTGWRVNVSLLPIVSGLVCCSLSDTSFHTIGFIAALLSNCVDCLQNVMTKRLLERSYTVSQLQFHTSLIAVIMQLMFLYINWMTRSRGTNINSTHSQQEISRFYLINILTLDGLGFYLQSVFAYQLMNLISPVTHSVANCVKRALLITLSIYHFGDIITPLNWIGMVLVIVGVYIFSVASRMEQNLAKVSPPDPVNVLPISSKIDKISEINIHRWKNT